jgi:hypothetical protein
MARGLALLLVLLAACADDAPAYVAGDYTIAMTARTNGCGFDNWTEGAATSVMLQIVQARGSADVNGSLQGGAAFVVGVLLGTTTFSGRVSGRDVEALLTSRYTVMQGQCSYNILLDLQGHLTGDSMQGTVDFTTSTNHHADCGSKENCHSIQDFNGTRPPTPP